MPDDRSIELEIEVPGTPEQVWQAIATGPGISSWYVPHTVEEREGGAATASFGPGPEMQISGRVVAWEPPHRIVFDGGETGVGLAFEWLVEARDGASCVVRLVNSGFGSGEQWDAQYDAMTEGWRLFLFNLKLHLEHFAGRQATAGLPMAMWSTPPEQTWAALSGALGFPTEPEIGQHITLQADADLLLAGVVADAGPTRLALVLDRPADGTAIVAVEGAAVSVWSYLYDAQGAAIVERDQPRWQRWLNEAASGAPGS